MKIKNFIIFIFSSLFSLQVQGFGGSSSGGGFVTGNQQNPWFLQNTREAFYCIDQDEEFFSPSYQLSQEKISKAFRYWRKAFIKKNEREYFKIATQIFTEVPCNASHVDIHFQLGKLKPEQMQSLPNPKALVGISFRQSYDERVMKGAGFVYLAPETGPLRPNIMRVDSRAWTLDGGIRLELALIHEIGHIFGVQHSGSTDQSVAEYVMLESFPWLVLGADNTDPDRLQLRLSRKMLEEAPHLGDYNGEYKTAVCSNGNPSAILLFQELRKYFSLQAITGCLKLQIKNHFQVALFFSVERNAPWEKLGEATEERPYYHEGGWYENFLTIKVAENRDVFRDLPATQMRGGFYTGFRVRSNKTVSTTFNRQNGGGNMPLLLTWEGDSISLGKIVNGKIEINEVYMSLLRSPLQD